MGAVATSLLVFAIVLGAALLGMFLRAVLPDHHLSSEAQDTVKLAMELVAPFNGLLQISDASFVDAIAPREISSEFWAGKQKVHQHGQ